MIENHSLGHVMSLEDEFRMVRQLSELGLTESEMDCALWQVRWHAAIARMWEAWLFGHARLGWNHDTSELEFEAAVDSA